MEGTVVLSFIVNPDGTLSNGKITRDIGAECGTAVLEVYKKMAANFVWIPGKQKGRAVPVELSFPVKFSLENGAKDKKGKRKSKKG